MSVGSGVVYGARLLIYLLRLVLFAAYGVLQFIGKPGSRYIVTVGIAVLAYMGREYLRWVSYHFLRGFLEGKTPDPLMVDALVVLAVVLAACAYIILSRVLALILGTFPKVTRPLIPLRRLKATNTVITPAVVRIAVPPLRRVAQPSAAD